MQPPQGLVEKVKGLGQAQAHRRLGAEGRPLGPLPGARARARSRSAARSSTAGRAIRRRSSRCRRSSRRTRGQARATSACTGCRRSTRSTTFMHWQIHKDGAADWRGMGERLDVAVALGLDPVTAYSASAPLAEAHRRAHARRLPARRARRAREGEDGRPRGAGAAPRSCSRATSRKASSARGAVRRPHGLLLAAGALPRLPSHLHDDAPRRDLPVDRRRRAARRGCLARQGDRAHLPTRRIRMTVPGDRRLRPAGRRRVPQLRHRLDPQGLPGSRQRR